MLYKCLFFFFLFTVLFEKRLCECEDDVCSRPLIEPGNCKARLLRYGFDGVKCRKFIWGGSNNNGNNFEHFVQCQATCEMSWNPDV